MVDLTLPDPSPAPGSTNDSGDAAARLVARVQAWQHRNPLARRLPAADVNGLGVIALPFGAPAADGKLQPLFHQPSLVPGLSHRALVEFALRHAVKYRPGPSDWPVREVERADASPDPAPETRYLLTAAITEPVKPGAQPRRLLIAPEGPAIWGPRPLSRRRVAEAIGVLLLIVLALAWGQRGRLAGGGGGPAIVSAVVSAGAPASAASVPLAARQASLPASAVAAASAPETHAAAVRPPVVAAAVPASVAMRGASASAPLVATPPPVPASSGRLASSPGAPSSSPAPKAASAPVAPASVALPPPPKLLPMPSLRGAGASAAASAPAPAASSADAPAGPHFALVSLPSKKRAGAEETLARVRKLLGPAIGNLQAQIMPTPDGFVVTIWPLPTEADAEQLANVLARRGVPMKWLEF